MSTVCVFGFPKYSVTIGDEVLLIVSLDFFSQATYTRCLQHYRLINRVQKLDYFDVINNRSLSLTHDTEK